MRITLAVVAAFSALAVLNLLPVHFGVYIVPTKSMTPTIRPMSLVVAHGKDFGTGDIVVWCSSPSFCVVHRVVNITDGHVVTKGDANPVPDKPVPLGMVKARVVAVVPPYAWLPPVAALIVYDLAREAREPIAPAVIIMAVGTLFAVLTATSVAKTPTSLVSVKAPAIYLKHAVFTRECSVEIAYTESLLSIGSVNVSVPPPLRVESVSAGSGYVVVHLDPGSIYELVSAGRDKFNLSVSAILRPFGTLSGTYTVNVPVAPLSVRMTRAGLLVENPNCYPVNVTVSFIAHGRREARVYRVSGKILVPVPAWARFVDYEYKLVIRHWGRLRAPG